MGSRCFVGGLVLVGPIFFLACSRPSAAPPDARGSAHEGAPTGPSAKAQGPQTKPVKPEYKFRNLPWVVAAERHVGPYESHVYELPLRVGDAVEVVIDQRGQDVRVDLRDPKGELVETIDGFSGALGIEEIVFVAPSSGTYQFALTLSGKEWPEARYSWKASQPQPSTPVQRSRSRALERYCWARTLSTSAPPSDPAAKGFADALTLARRTSWNNLAADAAAQLSRHSFERREWLLTRDRALDAAGLLFGTNRPLEESAALHLAALAFRNLKEEVQAEKHFRRALQIARDLERRGPRSPAEREAFFAKVSRLEAEALLALASQEWSLSSLSELPLLLEAVEKFERSDLPSGRVRALARLGAAEYRKGRFEAAKKVLEEATALFGDPMVLPREKGTVLATLGDVYLATGEPSRAIAQSQAALAVYLRTQDFGIAADQFTALATAFYGLERFEEGLNAVQKGLELALRLADRPRQARAWAVKGFLELKLGRTAEAGRSFSQALELASRNGLIELEMSARFGRALLQHQLGALAQAQHEVEIALDLVAKQARKGDAAPDRAAYFSRMSAIYDLSVEILLARERLEPGQGWAERAQSMAEAAYARSLDQVLRGKREQGASEREGAPHLASAARRAILEPGNLLLEIYLGASASHIWVSSAKSSRLVHIASRRQIVGLVNELAEALRHSDAPKSRKAASTLARQLGGLLLEPLQSDLEGVRRIVLVLPPDLQRVPFAVLPDPRLPDGGGAAPFSWKGSLGAGFEIAEIPSPVSLVALRERAAQRPSPQKFLALIGDAVSDWDDPRLRGIPAVRGSEARARDPFAFHFPRLLSADAEASSLSTRLGRFGLRKLLGFEATKRAVLAEPLADYSLVQVSTHGVFGEESVDGRAEAGLMLTRFDEAGQLIDGIFWASEVEKLVLRADLVLLASCSSGLGEATFGEGLAGLSQAFLKAGASRVVVSLWPVDDRATQALTQRFYAALVEQRLPPLAALRQAQRDVARRSEWSSPYYWAGFVLQGDWR